MTPLFTLTITPSSGDTNGDRGTCCVFKYSMMRGAISFDKSLLLRNIEHNLAHKLRINQQGHRRPLEITLKKPLDCILLVEEFTGDVVHEIQVDLRGAD